LPRGTTSELVTELPGDCSRRPVDAGDGDVGLLSANWSFTLRAPRTQTAIADVEWPDDDAVTVNDGNATSSLVGRRAAWLMNE